jgi:hypothetical protein
MQTVLGNIPRFRDAMRPALFWADFRPTTTGYRPPPLGAEQIDFLRTCRNDDGSVPLMARKFTADLALVDRVEEELWPLPIPRPPSDANNVIHGG